MRGCASPPTGTLRPLTPIRFESSSLSQHELRRKDKMWGRAGLSLVCTPTQPRWQPAGYY